MPHKCVTCDTILDDDAEEVMTGCACGCKVFQYVRGSICPEKEGVYEVNVKGLLKGEEAPSEDDEEPTVHDVDVPDLLKRQTLKGKRA